MIFYSLFKKGIIFDMNKPHALALHIFRRDLRLTDNTALLAALKDADQVLPCFIFDKRQLENNPYYYSNACVEFMLGCLADLQRQFQQHNSKLQQFPLND
jgi:deoxyribodipyrimidine photo-lyase